VTKITVEREDLLEDLRQIKEELLALLLDVERLRGRKDDRG